MTVTEDFSRVENTYQMEAEVRIQHHKKTPNNKEKKKCNKDQRKFADSFLVPRSRCSLQ